MILFGSSQTPLCFTSDWFSTIHPFIIDQIGDDVLNMLREPSKVWIGEYEPCFPFSTTNPNASVLLMCETMISSRYVFTQVSGYTFPMALAAMTAHAWQVGTFLYLIWMTLVMMM